MIPTYPKFAEINLSHRTFLHHYFTNLHSAISEFSFANLYLFRKAHQYNVSILASGEVIIIGRNEDKENSTFFMHPGTLPDKKIISTLLSDYSSMKCISEDQAIILKQMNFSVEEDRSNFDYLYLREKLSQLPGRHLHKKRNLIKNFEKDYDFQAKPLLPEYLPEAIAILDRWKQEREDEGDYQACKEALQLAEEIQLCGFLYYVHNKPAALVLGEEIHGGDTFVIQFEKAIGNYKGIWQFINKAFADILPDKYLYINREQDLGDENLRKAKMSYYPEMFTKKYTINI